MPMPKPSDFLRIIPETKEPSPKWVIYLIGGSCLPLVLVGVVYFFLNSKINSLENQKTELSASIFVLDSSAANKEAQKQVLETAKKIKDFSVVLEQHKYPSRFFEFVRSFCHKQVQLKTFNLDVKSAAVDFDAVADDFQALGEQLLYLNNREDIFEPQASGIALRKEGKVDFNLSFKFDPILLKKESK